MMTQNQGFEVISDSPASGEVNLEQYVGRTYVLYKYAEASRKLQRGSINILEVSFYLKEQERILKRKEYKKVVVSLDLEGEDKKYVKVGNTFADFDPLDLALVEPDTIFLLAKNSKKYQPVIEQLKNETNITQKRVRDLINDYRKPQKQETSDDNNSDTDKKDVSVWRRNKSGKRYCQIGSIHEEDEFTGVTIQRIVKEKGVLPQTVVRNAMSLVEACSSGQLVWVNNSQELNNDTLKSFFEIKEINTLTSVEAPNCSSPCIDSESQLPKNEELNETRELDAQQESRETSSSCDSTHTENLHPYSIESSVNSNLTLSEEDQSSEGLSTSATPSELTEVALKSEVSDDVNNSAISESTVDNSQMSELVVVPQSEADSELEKEAAIIAEYLSDVETWGEVASVMQNCPSDLKSSSWQLLSEEQKARIHKLKHEFEISDTFVATYKEVSDISSNYENENSLKVGDKVMWDNCSPHLQSWQPFLICRIDGDKAKLDYYANLVPLTELSLAH